VLTQSWQGRIRPAVRTLEPYVWEMSSEEVARRYGVPLGRVLRFDLAWPVNPTRDAKRQPVVSFGSSQAF